MGKIEEEKVVKRHQKIGSKRRMKQNMDLEKPLGIKKKVTKPLGNQINQQNAIRKKIKDTSSKIINIQQNVQKKTELFKQFSNSIEQRIEIPKTASKGQKERLLKKQKLMKKKLLDNYIMTNQKQQPQTFVLESLKNNIMELDKEQQKEQEQIDLDKNKGTSTHLRNKLLKEDQNRMKQVFQIKPFQENPLATMRLHLENTYKNQKK